MTGAISSTTQGSEVRQNLSPTRRLLNDILARFDLERPDGRLIYRYRITADEYRRGREILQKSSALLDPSNRHLCAVFVFITAEWYRREASTLWRQWSDVGVVPPDLAVSERGEIVEAGLRWWDLQLRVSSRREFLLTLALNGGLPSALIVGETGNRVRRFFESVMGDGLAAAAPSVEFLKECAERHCEALPESYRDGTIFELTAELIVELIACRATLPREQRQANPAGWLDASDPDWRERLPIYLPEDTAACNRLFNDLLTVEPRARSGGIGLRRMLGRTKSGDWVQGFLAQADGTLAFDALKSYSEGRFRAFFAGSAGQLISREFAQLYRSETGKNGDFEVTARAIGRPNFVGPVPFAETVAVALSRDGQTLPAVCWPGGQSRVSNCYVLKPTEREDRLELAGTGSVRSSLPVLYVLVQAETLVLGHQGGSAERVWRDPQFALWQMEGMALIETQSGERYRVQAGADETDERHLDFSLSFLPDLSLEDRSILVAEGPLRPRMVGMPAGQTAPQHQLRWIKIGRQIGNPETFAGLVTIQWQDEEGFLIDRARVLVLPRGASLEGRIESAGARIHWKNLPGWRIDAIDLNDTTVAAAEKSNDSIVCRWSGAPMGHQRLRLTDPDGASTIVSLRLRANRTMLVDAEGRIREDRPELSPAELRGASLLVEHSTLIDLDLRGAGNARALISRRVEGNTPMVRFGDLAQRLLGLSEERGPSVVVRDDQRMVCTIRRSGDEPMIAADKVRFFGSSSEDVIAVARPLIAAEKEYALSPVGDQTFELPPELLGPCLVYRRKGDAVLTRPARADRPIDHARIASLDPIARLAVVTDETARRTGYTKRLAQIAGDPSAGAEVSQIVGIIHSLRGLSPRALDLTRDLPKSPMLLCRLLLAASTERLEAILGLERDLPFLWMAQPLSAWQNAALTEWERAKLELEPIFGLKDATAQASAHMHQHIDTIAQRSGWFAGIRATMGFSTDLAGDLRQLAQEHVRLHADQPGPVATALIGAAERIGLPKAVSDLSYGHFATLLAPVVLAGLAAGRLTMTPDLAAGLRDALDIDHTYVSTAFPHCLKQVKP